MPYNYVHVMNQGRHLKFKKNSRIENYFHVSKERKHRSPYKYKFLCKAKHIKTQIPRKIIDMAAQIPAKRSSVGHLAGHVVRSDTRVRIIVQRCICDVVY